MVFLMPLRFVSGLIETLKRLGAARWRPGFVNRVFKRANAQVAESHDFAGAAETVGVADGARTPFTDLELTAGSY